MLKISEIFEFSKEKFWKIPILREFEWFEWFEMVRMVRSLADRAMQLCVARLPSPSCGDVLLEGDAANVDENRDLPRYGKKELLLNKYNKYFSEQEIQ